MSIRLTSPHWVAGLSVALGVSAAALAQEGSGGPGSPPAPRIIENTVSVNQVGTTSVTWKGRGASQTRYWGFNVPSARVTPVGVGVRVCDPVVDSVAANFNSIGQNSPVTLQLGTRQNEGFGSTYTAPASAFPIEITLIEAIFATIATGSGVMTAGYTIEVYDGTPSNGALVFSVPSDPDPGSTGLPGDLQFQLLSGACTASANAPASAVKLQFSVDQTADPVDRIFINNTSGTNQFTIFVRLTRLPNPNPTPCAIFGGEEDACSNPFPCTEANNSGSLNFPTRNWLFAINCPNNPLAAPGGFYTFQALPSFARPTRDALQQVTYVPTNCVTVTGACCNASTGACIAVSAANCTGSYQGDNTTCAPTNPCPQPTGACCLPSGACEIRAANLCTGSGFIFRGGGSVCASANCPQPTGACCNGTACAAGVSAATCGTLGGQFMGAGTTCSGAGGTCPLGACCLASGACSANISQNACTTQGGTFQGVGSTCGSVSCPQPNGACCTSGGGCAEVNQATCGLFGGTWQGAQTTCGPSTCTPQLGLCCRGATCAASVQASQCTGSFTQYISGSTATCPGTNTSPCCKANFNKTGGISVQDIFDFLSAWFAADPIANMTNNGVGAPGVQSIFDFLAAWFGGGCS